MTRIIHFNFFIDKHRTDIFGSLLFGFSEKSDFGPLNSVTANHLCLLGIF